MSPLAVGIDVGGTFAKLVAADSRGRLLRQASLPSLPQEGPERFLERLAWAVRGLTRGLGRVEGIGLGIAGDIDGPGELLRYSPNLEGWRNVDLSPLGRRLGVRLRVENDASAAAWGLYVLELRGRVRNLLAVTLGTGVGGGWVLEGRLHSGSHGTAGEIGHITVYPGGELCSCGGKGHLEAYAGGRAMLRRYGELSGGGGGLTPEELAGLARRGDRAARQVWQAAGTALGLAIANAAYLVNPDAVLLTGGVSRAHPLFLPALRRALRPKGLATPLQGLSLRVARRQHAGALGAALLALQGAQCPS